MDILRESPVGVLNDDVVGKRPKALIRAPDVRILFDADDASFARGTHDRACRHRPIHRVFAGGAGAVTESAARSLHHNVTPGAEGHGVVRLVSRGGTPGAKLPVGLIVVMPAARFVGYVETN